MSEDQLVAPRKRRSVPIEFAQARLIAPTIAPFAASLENWHKRFAMKRGIVGLSSDDASRGRAVLELLEMKADIDAALIRFAAETAPVETNTRVIALASAMRHLSAQIGAAVRPANGNRASRR